MRVFLMTDLEGVAGVLSFEGWDSPGERYYEVAREFLTLEANAAVDGFFAGGATEVLVVDGHGPGGIDLKLLDPRVQFQHGMDVGWPLGLDASFDAIAWVGQHAKAGTPYGHLAHTHSCHIIDETINGISVGEFGQLAMCASELGVPAAFASGDEAFTQEAQALVPGIETVSVKQGLRAGPGATNTFEEYVLMNGPARNLHPVQARERIRAGAQRALKRVQREPFGIIPLAPPYTRVVSYPRAEGRTVATMMRVSHPSSVIGVLSKRRNVRPLPDAWVRSDKRQHPPQKDAERRRLRRGRQRS